MESIFRLAEDFTSLLLRVTIEYGSNDNFIDSHDIYVKLNKLFVSLIVNSKDLIDNLYLLHFNLVIIE